METKVASPEKIGTRIMREAGIDVIEFKKEEKPKTLENIGSGLRKACNAIHSAVTSEETKKTIGKIQDASDYIAKRLPTDDDILGFSISGDKEE